MNFEFGFVSAVGCRTERPKTTLRSVLGTRKKVTFDLNVKTYELITSNDYSECEETDEIQPQNQKLNNQEIQKESNSNYPSNYRYKNFIEFEDDDDDTVNDDTEDEDEFNDCLNECFQEDDDHELYHSIDGATLIETSDDERFTVLKPVENTAQWRAVKSKKTLLQQCCIKYECKENVVAIDERFDTNVQQEIRVDASLSVWIGGNGNQLNLIKARTI